MDTKADVPPQKKDYFALAITSLVLGIFSLLGFILPICGLPMSILGLIFGIISTTSSKRGLAIAGIVLSVTSLILATANVAIGAYLGYTGQLFQ